jgi:hypothetical protein
VHESGGVLGFHRVGVSVDDLPLSVLSAKHRCRSLLRVAPRRYDDPVVLLVPSGFAGVSYRQRA